MKKAFTLIELLVVVLIIGILADIALPKYQVAVNKSRYAGLMPLARSVKSAEEEMYMARGGYTSQLDNLSIQLPGTVNGNSVTNDKVTVEVYDGEGDYGYVKASRSDLDNTLVMYFERSGNFPGEIHCEALKDGDGVNKQAKQICESLGGQELTGKTGTDSNYVAYVLEGVGNGTGSGASTGSTRSWADWRVASWDCSDGFSCYGYDEYGNRIVYAEDCGDTYESCGDKESNSYISLYDENGTNLGLRSCQSHNADASCNGYAAGTDYVYDDDGSLTSLRCSNVLPDGTCDGYKSASVRWSNVYTIELYGDELEVTRSASCSVFDSNGCTVYSSIMEDAAGSAWRDCLEISGTTCLTWGEWN